MRNTRHVDRQCAVDRPLSRGILSAAIALGALVSPSSVGAVAGQPSPRVVLVYSDRGRLLVIGDSLTVESDQYATGRKIGWLGDALRTAPATGEPEAVSWRAVTVEARYGKQTTWGRIMVARAIKAQPTTTAIIVALGTNDVTRRRLDYAARIRAVLDAAKGRPVVWLTIDLSDSVRSQWRRNGEAFNRALHTVAGEPAYAAQLTVANWAQWFPDSCIRRADFARDGLHFRPAGNACRGEYLVKVSREIHQAVFGPHRPLSSAPR